MSLVADGLAVQALVAREVDAREIPRAGAAVHVVVLGVPRPETVVSTPPVKGVAAPVAVDLIGPVPALDDVVAGLGRDDVAPTQGAE